MVKIEELAEAALRREGLRLRSLTQDLLSGPLRLCEIPRPDTDDPRLLAAAASLVELFAARLGEEPPAWTQDIGPLPEPIYLVEAAEHLKRLRLLCETQAPEALHKRGFYAPPNFLEFA